MWYLSLDIKTTVDIEDRKKDTEILRENMNRGKRKIPVKKVTWIFSCLFDGSLVWFENETKSDGKPIIFLANAMEIP